jgi:hypothetical protein
MTLLTVTEYLCHKWPEYVAYVIITIRFFSHLWLIIGFITRQTQRVQPVEQELFTLHSLNSKHDISYDTLRLNTVVILEQVNTRVSSLWFHPLRPRYTCSFMLIVFIIQTTRTKWKYQTKHGLRGLYLTLYWNALKVIH